MGSSTVGPRGAWPRRSPVVVPLAPAVVRADGLPIARKTFTVVDIIEIFVHWYAGRSRSEVATSPGVDAKTVRKYLRPAEGAGIVPGGPPMSEEDWAKLIRSWFPAIADRRLRQITWGAIEPHREFMKELLGTVTMSTIHQRLRSTGAGAAEEPPQRPLHARLP